MVPADIFFIITSTTVIIVGVGFAIALYLVIQILRDVRKIIRTTERIGNTLEKDIEKASAYIKSKGSHVAGWAEVAMRFITKRFTKTKSRGRKKDAGDYT